MLPAFTSKIQGFDMIIIGAGMAGLLAGQYFRSMDPTIIEKADGLPNNHHALLRFRSNAVSDLTGIRFKKVKVHKMINYKGDHYTQSNLMLNNLYSEKVTGGYYPRSALNLDPAERFIAPPNFIEMASIGLDIEYESDANGLMVNTFYPIISTMPIAALAEMLNYNLDEELETRPIWTVKFNIDTEMELYQTVYYPNPEMPLYRMSITDDRVIAEFISDPRDHWGDKLYDNLAHFLEIDFGIIQTKNQLHSRDEHMQKHGKLVPADREPLQEFFRWATVEHNIYSLGRWGTHRQLLMDDVVNDLRVIGNMIDSNNYRR